MLKSRHMDRLEDHKLRDNCYILQAKAGDAEIVFSQWMSADLWLLSASWNYLNQYMFCKKRLNKKCWVWVRHNGVLAMQMVHLSIKPMLCFLVVLLIFFLHSNCWPSCFVNPSSRSHMLSDKQHLLETMQLNGFYWFPASENPVGIWQLGHNRPVKRFQILIPCCSHSGNLHISGEKNTDIDEWDDRCKKKTKKNRKNPNHIHYMLVIAQLLSIRDSVCCAKIPYQYTFASLLSVNTIDNVGYIACIVWSLCLEKKVLGHVWDVWIADNNDYHSKHY